MVTKRLGIIGLLLLVATISWGATSLQGFVIDETSGEPLPVANVVVVGTNRGASTNLDGYFSIPGVQEGIATLRVSYIGYYGKEMTVEVQSGSMEPLEIELIPQSVKLEEVEYSVSREDDDEHRQSARVSTVPVSAGTIRNMPALGAEMDVLRAMQAIPGVKASSEISSALYVRGGSADMTLIQMDQNTVYNPSHLFGIFSTFNGDAVKHIELMKGGFPAEYGGRSGSVLEVVTNDGNRKKVKGLGSIGLISARGALEGPLWNKKGSYAISARRTYLDILLNALKNSIGGLPDYYFYDSNGKVNFDISNKTTITLNGYVGKDFLGYDVGPDDSQLKIRTDWGNDGIAGRLRHVLADDAFLTVGWTFSRYRSGVKLSNEGVLIQQLRNRFSDQDFRADLEYYGIENHTIKTGVDARRYSVEVTNKNEEVTFVSIDSVAWNVSHYLQDKWRISSQFEVLPGLRYYWHEKSDGLFLDPRMAVVYHYDPKTRFKLAGGQVSPVAGCDQYRGWCQLL